MNKAHRYMHLRRALAVLVALAALIGLAPPAHASSTLDSANRAFAQGHYADAAAQYRALIDAQGYSAPVLFDLGNAYLRDGKPVDAMLAYERARLLAPRDRAIAGNLAEASAAAGVADVPRLSERLSHLLTINEWTWAACGAAWALITAAGAAVLFRRRRAWFVRAAVASALVGAVSLAGLLVSGRDQHVALVMRSAPVLVSPFDGAQSGFTLGAGSSVELGRVHDAFVLVHARDGRVGWMERSAVAPLVADGAKLGA